MMKLLNSDGYASSTGSWSPFENMAMLRTFVRLRISSFLIRFRIKIPSIGLLIAELFRMTLSLLMRPIVKSRRHMSSSFTTNLIENIFTISAVLSFSSQIRLSKL